jgi:hypothetical protein
VATGTDRRFIIWEARRAAKVALADLMTTALVLKCGPRAKSVRREDFGRTFIAEVGAALEPRGTDDVVAWFSGIVDGKDLVQDRIDRLRAFHDFARLKDIANQQWSSLEHKLGRKRNVQSTGDSARLIATVSHLVGKDIDAITTDHMVLEGTPVPGAGGSQAPSTDAARILLDYHETIYDHRHLIVGELQLPRSESELFPCVFVRPDNLGLWFPQDVVRLKEGGGTAFVCHARFGNPDGIGHEAQRGSTWRGVVVVYALRAKPDKDRLKNPLTDSALEDLVASCGLVAKRGPFPIKRIVPLVDVVVEAGGERGGPSTFTSAQVTKCRFPVTISWNCDVEVSFELRQMPRDTIVAGGDVPPRGKVRVLPKGAQPVTARDVRVIELEGPGLYRVRSWLIRKPVLDAELEFWLDIQG